MVEERLLGLGYHKVGRNNWAKDGRVVHTMHSSEFGKYIRIKWREKWKNDFALIFDYSSVDGPISIVPVRDLFSTDFVREKRKKESYANSGYWWSQRFPIDHELVKLVLGLQIVGTFCRIPTAHTMCGDLMVLSWIEDVTAEYYRKTEHLVFTNICYFATTPGKSRPAWQEFDIFAVKDRVAKIV